jgi:glycosyltransferase involved in cell wall biosynthesis
MSTATPTAARYRVAAIVPCHNEEVAVARVVEDLYAAVPGITVHVYDNCSTDRTAERARAAGAVVSFEPLKGMGNAVRRAFADIDADIYLLIDGDDTYDAYAAPGMIAKLVEENLYQVVGARRRASSRSRPS